MVKCISCRVWGGEHVLALWTLGFLSAASLVSVVGPLCNWDQLGISHILGKYHETRRQHDYALWMAFVSSLYLVARKRERSYT